MEEIVYHIAENECPDNWPNALQEIHNRLTSQNESLLISGLLSLKNIIEAFEHEIDSDRKPLHHLVELFFPVLENLVSHVSQNNSQNQIFIMI